MLHRLSRISPVWGITAALRSHLPLHKQIMLVTAVCCTLNMHLHEESDADQAQGWCRECRRQPLSCSSLNRLQSANHPLSKIDASASCGSLMHPHRECALRGAPQATQAWIRPCTTTARWELQCTKGGSFHGGLAAKFFLLPTSKERERFTTSIQPAWLMRTGLCSCLSLLQQGNETMADRLLVLVPYEQMHAPRSILEQARKLGPDVTAAIKHTMELIAHSHSWST